MPAPVLVVEDDEITLLILTTQLQQWGLEVLTATSAGEAWTRLQSQPLALALVDLQLAAQRGEALVARLRDHPGCINWAIPVIAISARLETAAERRLTAAGFDAWLVKPVTPQRLGKVLTAFLPLPDRSDDGAAARPHPLRRKFLAELPVSLNHIGDALHRQAWDEARRRVHKLHGSAGFCGFTRLRRLAAELETALAREDPVQIGRSWTALKKAARHLDDGGPADVKN